MPTRNDELRASLIARIEELARRVRHARQQFDVSAYIVKHPLASVGVASALGALLGLRGGKRSLARAAIAGLGALALRIAKEFVFRQAADSARTWWKAHEPATSTEPPIDTVFEH